MMCPRRHHAFILTDWLGSGADDEGDPHAHGIQEEQLRLEDIRVTLIEPGVVDTDLPTHVTDEVTHEAMQKVYDIAAGEPEEIAERIGCVIFKTQVAGG